jgi:hypothetical protein
MKNLMSYNQMAEWVHHEDTNLEFNQDDLIDEYFDCLIDCDDNANQCRQVCSQILK